MNEQIRRGDIVNTPFGAGFVVYVRMAAPDYATVQAVSVYLDAKLGTPHYSGTMFDASLVSVTVKGN